MEGLSRLFNYYKKWQILALAAFAGLASVFFRLVIPLVLAYLIDYVLGGQTPTGAGILANYFQSFGGRDFILNRLWLFALLLVALVFIKGVFDYSKDRAMVSFTESGTRNLRQALYRQIQELDFAWHSQVETGDIVQRCSSDVDTLRRFFEHELLELLSAITIVLLSTILLLYYDPVLCIFSLLLTPVLFFSSYRYFRERKETFEKWDEAEGDLSTRLQENASGIRVVKAFARQDKEIAEFRAKNRFLHNYGIETFEVMANFWLKSDILTYLDLIMVLILGSIRVIDGKMTLGVLLIFISYSQQLIDQLRYLARLLANAGKAQISFGRLREILDHETEPDESGLAQPDLQGEITFDSVSFAYPDSDQKILEDISFSLPAGQTLGILGPTGSGKSSLLLLLQKLYPASSGRILLDRQDIRDIDRKCLRRQIGLILQEPFIYSRTIGDNIRFPRPEASDREVREVAGLAHIDEDIKGFKQAYATEVGERGVTLSGGQKQRLAIARSLIRNCPVLVFDDSLSALDTETDKQIRQDLASRQSKATTIIVSHRLSSLMEADWILVLEEGRISDQGRPSDLVERPGLFQRIYRLQADWLAGEVTGKERSSQNA